MRPPSHPFRMRLPARIAWRGGPPGGRSMCVRRRTTEETGDPPDRSVKNGRHGEAVERKRSKEAEELKGSLGRVERLREPERRGKRRRDHLVDLFAVGGEDALATCQAREQGPGQDGDHETSVRREPSEEDTPEQIRQTEGENRKDEAQGGEGQESHDEILDALEDRLHRPRPMECGQGQASLD